MGVWLGRCFEFILLVDKVRDKVELYFLYIFWFEEASSFDDLFGSFDIVVFIEVY